MFMQVANDNNGAANLQSAVEHFAENLLTDFDVQDFATFLDFLMRKTQLFGLLQDFEVDFLRTNDYRLQSFSDITKVIKLDNSCKEKFFIFLKIAELGAAGGDVEQFITQTENEIALAEEKLKKSHDKQLTFDNTDFKAKKLTLSPTQGIAMLTSNPYQFFTDKVLDLKSINDWETNIDARLYGTLMHKILHLFTQKCIQIRQFNLSRDDNLAKMNEDLFLNVANDYLHAEGIEVSGFIWQKICNTAKSAVQLEREAFFNSRDVLCEQRLSHKFDKYGIEIVAIADRIEVDNQNKLLWIYDYKTGTAPSNSDEIYGRHTQLAIIAILATQYGNFDGYTVSAMQYLGLTGKQNLEDGGMKRTEIRTSMLGLVQDYLENLLQYFFDNNQPNPERMIYINQAKQFSDNRFIENKHFSRQKGFIC